MEVGDCHMEWARAALTMAGTLGTKNLSRPVGESSILNKVREGVRDAEMGSEMRTRTETYDTGVAIAGQVEQAAYILFQMTRRHLPRFQKCTKVRRLTCALRLGCRSHMKTCP